MRSFLKPRSIFGTLSFALIALVAAHARAAVTDVSQTPLIVATPDSAKANLLFVLDDSGSMNFDFMPDHVNGDGSPDPALCRSSGATNLSSGNFGSACCVGGNNSAACWTGVAPFGTMRGQPPFLAAGFNGLAYDPTVVYRPPTRADGTLWATQNSANTGGWTLVRNDAYNVQNTTTINLTNQFPDTEWCADTAFTDCLRNDNYVLPGTVNGRAYTYYRATVATGSGSVARGAPDQPMTSTRSFGPHYYNIVVAEYCSADDLRNCRSGAATGYSVPAKVRWCNSDAQARAATPASGACQAVRNDVFVHARFPTKYFTSGTPATNEVRARTTFSISSDSNCPIQVVAVNVNGMNLLSAATAASNARNTIGARIVNNINARTAATGYSAVSSNSGRTVTIVAPIGVDTRAAVSFSFTPSPCGFNVDNAAPQFSGYSATSPATQGGYPGRFERVDIVPGNIYPKASSRTDCAGGTCTYAEEMTNFANWWSYYHSRMQSMKSSTALAFNDVGSNRRVGYLSINNNTSRDFLNLDTFDGGHRTNWFGKLQAAIPNNSTPLRSALSVAGKLYAGRYNGAALYGSSVVDPVQYSCQKNFAILSTDGFWNETATPTQLNGSTAIGDQDEDLARPQLDGAGVQNTLADVASYYFRTDLRTGAIGSSECRSGSGTGADVCGTGDPAIEMQRMTTFTLGLGASGYMQFSKDYLKGGSADFNAVGSGATANAAAGICTWQVSGVCNWPAPVSNTLTTIDDLWHAAVNGGGTYFSASNPKTLYEGLTSALVALDGRVGSAAAATLSNPNISAGDNKVFVSNFKSAEWTGELRTLEIDVGNGTLKETGGWSARNKLNTRTTPRKIYGYLQGAADNRRNFADWNTLSSDEKSKFGKAWITATGRGLSQFCVGGVYCLSSADQDAASGSPLHRYVMGERTNEGEIDDPAKFYRARAHLLGDIVGSEATYVYKPQQSYTDGGYRTFGAGERTPMVYVGANDGMLHAFDASTGEEAWAYVPSAVVPNLYRLADKQYASEHQFFVDSTPVAQDIKVDGAWRTILVGGLGAGGRSYYALDVTQSNSPKVLWEFTDPNLGLTFSPPEIGKLRNGTWVVIFGSGYNNVSPGDGKARLFILNALTGAREAGPIVANAGDTTTPAGLAYVRGWVESPTTNNTIERVYGGDNLGNVWRFDVNDNIAPAGLEAQLLATLRSPTNIAQPVSSRPELGLVDERPMIFIGTGRYLGLTDLTDSGVQTIYAIKDRLDSQSYGNPRTAAGTAAFVRQTLSDTASACPAGSAGCKNGQIVRKNTSPQRVVLANQGGWYVDLPQSRERVNADPQLMLGTLAVTSNVVDIGDLCKAGGSSWLNLLNYRTGTAVNATDGVASILIGSQISPRASAAKVGGGDVFVFPNNTFNGQTKRNPQPTRRMYWRDILLQ